MEMVGIDSCYVIFERDYTVRISDSYIYVVEFIFTVIIVVVLVHSLMRMHGKR